MGILVINSELRAILAASSHTVQTVRAAVFYPPLDRAAEMLVPLDRWLDRHIAIGGTFLMIAGRASVSD